MNIRSASVKDLEQLKDLLKLFGKVDESGLEDRITVRIKNPTDCLVVAEDNDKLAGYAWAQSYGQHMRGGEITARLNDLFVLPEFRNQGIGTQLFNAITNWAKTTNVKYLQWQAGTIAVPFYEKLGLKGDTKSDLETHPFYEIEY